MLNFDDIKNKIPAEECKFQISSILEINKDYISIYEKEKVLIIQKKIFLYFLNENL